MKLETRKCPHGARHALVFIQVMKEGPWEKRAPRRGGYALYIGGDTCGGYVLARGSKREMLRLQQQLLARLKTLPENDSLRGDMRYVQTAWSIINPEVQKLLKQPGEEEVASA